MIERSVGFVAALLVLCLPVSTFAESEPADLIWKVGDHEFELTSGSLSISNEKKEEITEGKLVLLDGWPAMHGKKGAKFAFYQGDADPIPADSWKLHQNSPKTRKEFIVDPKVVGKARYTKEGSWEILNEHFYFVYDFKGRPKCNYGASFNRNVEIVFDDQAVLPWGTRKIQALKQDARVLIVRGEITEKDGVTIAEAKK